MKKFLLIALAPIMMMACKKDQTSSSENSTNSSAKSAAQVSVGTDDFYGVMFSYNESVSKGTPVLNDLGVRWCRVWVNITDWSTPSNNTGNAFQQAIDLHKAGFKVILIFNSYKGKVPTYSQAKAVYEWALQKPDLKASVDIWEIFNELNNKEYYELAYSTSLTMAEQAQYYVKGALKAAWDVFHVNNSEPVLGGSWTLWQQKEEFSTTGSYNLKVTQAYLDNGYLNYCDYAGIHPYHDTPTGQRNFTSDFKNRVGTKPIIISEWGLKLKNYSNAETYTKAMDENLSFMKSNVFNACYYRFTPGNGYYGLVSGTNYENKVEPAYSTYKNWPRN